MNSSGSRKTVTFTVRIPIAVGDALLAAQEKTGMKYRAIAQQAIAACIDDPAFIGQLQSPDTEKAA